MHYRTIDSPIGKIVIEADEVAITGIHFKIIKPEAKSQGSEYLLNQCEKELSAYFEGTLKEFTVPVRADGTPFRMKVWEELRKIPYGEVSSYKDIANAIGNPKAVRAVGGANHNNPISIIIPCHRVIGADGSLTGYGGGLDAKKYLLELEGSLS